MLAYEFRCVPTTHLNAFCRLSSRRVYLLRFVLGVTLVVAGVAIPMWPSVLAVIVMGYLAFEGFRLSSKPKSAS